MIKQLAYLNGFRCVEAAARHHSYTKAAHELNVTQAAVSQQIRLIEEVLGTKLFHRRGHEMRLTPKGKVLAQHLSQAFKLMAHGIQQIQAEPLEGPLHITTTQSFATMFLMGRLWDFYRLHPEIQIKVTVSSDVEDLIHGEMDAAIRHGFFEVPELDQTLLFEGGLAPLCSPNLLNHVDLTKIQNLRDCALVDPDQEPGRDWMSWLAQAGLRVEKSEMKWLQVSNLDVALSAVLGGHGLFLGSPILAKRLIEAGSLVQPFEFQLAKGVRYSFLFDQNSSRLIRIKVFKAWLLAQFQTTETAN